MAEALVFYLNVNVNNHLGRPAAMIDGENSHHSYPWVEGSSFNVIGSMVLFI